MVAFSLVCFERDNVRDNPDAGDVVTVVVGKIAKHTNGDLRGPAPSGLVFIALLYSEFCYWRRLLLGLGIPRPSPLLFLLPLSIICWRESSQY